MATQTDWTAEYVMEMGVIGNVAQDIADAHNAALAAERERASRTLDVLEATALESGDARRSNSPAERNQTDLWKRQAAFESEHREKYRSRNIEDAKTIQQLRQQLAAAVEVIDKIPSGCGFGGSGQAYGILTDLVVAKRAALAKIRDKATCDELRGQLAAEKLEVD